MTFTCNIWGFSLQWLLRVRSSGLWQLVGFQVDTNILKALAGFIFVVQVEVSYYTKLSLYHEELKKNFCSFITFSYQALFIKMYLNAPHWCVMDLEKFVLVCFKSNDILQRVSAFRCMEWFLWWYLYFCLPIWDTKLSQQINVPKYQAILNWRPTFQRSPWSPVSGLVWWMATCYTSM